MKNGTVISIPKNELLDLVVCADTYGFNRDVLMYSLYEFIEPITEEDINFYIDEIKSNPQYTEEDHKEMRETIEEFIRRYKK